MDLAIAMTAGASIGYLSLAMVAVAIVVGFLLIHWVDGWETIGKGPLALDSAPPRPTIDNELRAEVRGIVVARNERRTCRGEVPLDVDAEIERQLSDLIGFE